MSITTSIHSKLTEVVAAATVAALVAVAPPSLLAQQAATAATATAQPRSHATAQSAEAGEQAPPSSKDPGHEGIRVHGHWVIDVRDKDGKLVEHRDFQNALTPNAGNSLLLRMLAGTAIPERFAVYLTSNQVAGSGLSLYGMAQAGSYSKQLACDGFYYICNTSLTQKLTGPDQYGGAVALQLSGQLTADRNLQFSKVESFLDVCEDTRQDNNTATQNQTPLTVSPSACVAHTVADPINPAGGSFTGTTITPLVLTTGQVLTVTVTLSFS